MNNRLSAEIANFRPALKSQKICSLAMSSQSASYNFGLQLITAASFAFFPADLPVHAFVPDLSESPLKSATPSIVVEGAARVVDGYDPVIRKSTPWSLH